MQSTEFFLFLQNQPVFFANSAIEDILLVENDVKKLA